MADPERCPKDRVHIVWPNADTCQRQLERNEPCFCDHLPSDAEVAWLRSQLDAEDASGIPVQVIQHAPKEACR